MWCPSTLPFSSDSVVHNLPMIKFITSISEHSLFSSFNSKEEEVSLEATGALKVIIQSAHIDIRGPHSWWRRPPKPFVLIQVNDTKATTGAQAGTYDPSWITQTFFLLVKSPKEELRLVVYDHHAHRNHRLLGAASFDMSRLAESGMALDAELPLLKEKKRRGDLLCSLFYYPILASPDNENAIGIVRLIVHRAEEIQPTDASRRLNVMANVRLGWNAPTIHVTPRKKILANGSAVWESMHEFLCFDKSSCVVYFEVLDPHLEDPILGHLCIGLTDLVEATIARRRPWPLSGSAAGKLVASAEWRPLNLVPRP
ncbi:hypothetical protein C8R44DRAFT_867858 [Mycena epipterygia]|nr:hypothetical protein C8R44DRAFT_867858 [Mycena epipterygia]